MMLELITALNQRLYNGLVLPGTVGRNYLGIAGQEDEALTNSADFVIIDDAGEDTVAESTSSTQCKLYHIRYQLFVRALTVNDAVTRLLQKSNSLEAIVYAEDGKLIMAGGTIIAESVGGFFAVESDTIGGDNVPTWRYRAATVDYRAPITTGGYHPY